jgi:hypothetical protein
MFKVWVCNRRKYAVKNRVTHAFLLLGVLRKLFRNPRFNVVA